MPVVNMRISRDGRVVIPARYRAALGLKPGDGVIIGLDDQEIRIYSLQHSIERARRLVRRFVPEGVSLVQELLEERRKESHRS